ncbi:hypothetical protein KIN20_025472 [Parelaphostrongylus tenuis]|uniref:Uncharacterized protein n=1 Tax=Parelaphostrongylus tenuis TaxID=148309 RepID=A0AAD5QUG2_PARTN|nr:hypothetical protein KIN20_025472 [Parelaphostrongylus tenuis]
MLPHNYLEKAGTIRHEWGPHGNTKIYMMYTRKEFSVPGNELVTHLQFCTLVKNDWSQLTMRSEPEQLLQHVN